MQETKMLNIVINLLQPLKARLHDATCRMRLSFWRMKTTAEAIISAY